MIKIKRSKDSTNTMFSLFVYFFAFMTIVGFSNIYLFHRFYKDPIYAHANGLDPNNIRGAGINVPPENIQIGVLQEDAVAKVIKSGFNAANIHAVAGLNCEDHGGPSNDIAKEMIFWNDIKSDAEYKSPFYDEDKYITFEPDSGGFNNIRMAYETILVLAHATGRTLVLPPEKKMYLLGKGPKEHKKEFGFNDFFHLDAISMEHEGMNIITMEEFLKRKGLTGQLKNLATGEVLKPPKNQVEWNGKSLGVLWEYLRKVGKYPDDWSPSSCVAAIPASPDPKHIEELRQMHQEILAGQHGGIPNPEKDFIDAPVEVDAPTVERLREIMASRKNLCIYDSALQNEPLLHFKVDHSVKARMLTHFYSFIFFQDWKQDLWSKRFVRDHIRYVDEIVCAAARIVNAVRERARKKSPENEKGEYDSFHVRRGDFQYKGTRVEATVLYQESKEHLKEGATLYIATDERDKTFFEPLKNHYDVTFLDDYMDLIEGVNTNYYGMLDQLVAYKGRVFYGTYRSTLSGYINRMRGYYSTKEKLPGYELGTLQSYYFVPKDKKYVMSKYSAVKLPLFMQEFPVSWRDIDKGTDTLV
jgi:hypothetical protein